MRISPLVSTAKHVHTYEIFIARIRDCSQRFFSLISPSSYEALCRLRTHQRDGRVSVENRAAPLRNRFLMSLLLHIHTQLRSFRFSSHAFHPLMLPSRQFVRSKSLSSTERRLFRAALTLISRETSCLSFQPCRIPPLIIFFLQVIQIVHRFAGEFNFTWKIFLMLFYRTIKKNVLLVK